MVFSAETDAPTSVAENLAGKYNKVRKGVTESMEGVVLEYPTKTAYKKGLAEGKAEGIAEWQTKIAALVTAMLAAGATEDLARAMKDEAFREEQFKKYHIE